jgi:hypothetical protein
MCICGQATWWDCMTAGGSADGPVGTVVTAGRSCLGHFRRLGGAQTSRSFMGQTGAERHGSDCEGILGRHAQGAEFSQAREVPIQTLYVNGRRTRPNR